MSELKIGNVVMLKTGQEPMTVRSIDGDKVVCQWFFGAILMKDEFNINTLDICKEKLVEESVGFWGLGLKQSVTKWVKA